MFFMVEGGGFEPPKSYDDRFTVCSLWPLGNPSRVNWPLISFSGAGDGTRTRNLLITSQLLYQLSYASRARHLTADAKRILYLKQSYIIVKIFFARCFSFV